MTQNTTDTPVIRTDDLEVTYTGDRDVTALNGVSVDFSENRLTAIIGPSGCGKSTLLKSLNRLHEIQPNADISGEVFLEDEPVYDTDEPLPEIRRRVGYVPQKPTPLPVSIYNNVAYGPKIHGDYSREELDDIVETQLRKVNLWDEVNDRLDAPGAELSTGQIQRLCLARSLAAEPDVLLCDEVTSALDPLSAEQVEETLADLKEEYTIIMVTHSMEQARRLADDVLFLYLGDVVETNDTRSFFENPQHERTKQFVGGHTTVADDTDSDATDTASDDQPVVDEQVTPN
ncbi:phosphate ABC transporter ATP-binding protein [Natronolimnobius sp. AArcel1]|uniref:phosphate ABC transporter ATP-binding protein n=1 Tax=Natronolimnobius sp. AArcel1 TaxID=1679093 RepID=UPI0013E9AC59|nr:phosphate ABC transporter ATP-binding protein [Natronolimnobius sp. AArcel1]NGM71605.1 phosphate ABC transporter ATP-binding protein [Natronolimnobius sp. AArcel1]